VPACSAAPPESAAGRAQRGVLCPGDPEVLGLLAMLLLIDARRPARTTPDGQMSPDHRGA
jgi:predicted RNA polymerase sigma factor